MKTSNSTRTPVQSDGAQRKKLWRVLIADDEAINRMGLRFLLDGCDDVEIVAEACNGQEAFQKTLDCAPDLILMDVTMPEMDGIATTRAIRKVLPAVKILVLTSVNGAQEISDALEAGANGYCLKDSKPEDFMIALNVVRAGNIFLDSKALPFLLQSMSPKQKKQEHPSEKTSAYEPLSDHELLILSMKMRGIDDIDTAKQLNVSLETLRNLEDRIKQKIVDLENRPAGVRPETNQSSVRYCQRCESVYQADAVRCPDDGEELVDELLSKRIGTTLGGKYELLSFIGKGGGASVFKARHTFLNQNMAVKIIHAEHATDFTMLQRFRGEAEVASQLNHPNIVKVHDFGITESGTPYLAMEYLEGINLAKYLMLKGKLEWSEIVTIFWQVCAAMEFAHQNQLIHRDIKPSNIFLSRMPNGELVVKLVDFGLAKSVDAKRNSQALTLHGQIVGTPDYMSPESCRGIEYTVASDIYSLGCTMFECVSGAPPFKGSTIAELMYRHIRDDVPALDYSDSSLAAERQLANLINRCLQKDPADRYRNAAEIKNELFNLPLSL